MKVYLCSRVGKDAHIQNEAVAKTLRKAGIGVYVPHEQEVNSEKGSRDHNEIFKLDHEAMLTADLCVVVPRIGNDCCGELGYFAAKGVPILAVGDWNLDFLGDPMIKEWINLVFTTSEGQFGKLLEDRYFDKTKCFLAPKLSDMIKECERLLK